MEFIEWLDGKVKILDQTRLPLEEVYLELSTHQDVAQAIKEMKVRGAPMIGVIAAYGVALGAQGDSDRKSTRLNSSHDEALIKEAKNIHANEEQATRRIAKFGAELIGDGFTVLTHCNAGALATSGYYGTALGAIKAAR